MDTKQLIDQFADGEITEEQFDAEVAKLTPEDQEKLNQEAAAKLPSAVEKLKGVRRGIEKVAIKADDTVSSKLREENFETAKGQIFKDLGIESAEEQALFETEFKKQDPGSVNVDNIVKDMRRYFAGTKSDEYFTLKEQQRKREQEAEEFTAQNGGVGGTGGGSDPDKKVSQEVKDFMTASARQGRVITPEQAERAINVAKRGGRIG